LKIPCTVVVPENAPQVKLSQILSLGAIIKSVPFGEYQSIQCRRNICFETGKFVHPFADPAVMAGNGVIGLEILEQLPEVNTVVIPYGGGGLSCGVASAVKALKPSVKVIASEVDIASPFSQSFLNGEPVEVSYQHSFVNGIGAPFVFPEMWEMAFSLLDGSISVSLEQISRAIRLIALQNHIIAEGAGGVAAAAALTGQAGYGKIVCIVSGGNIEMDNFVKIMKGETP
jgi:threonine dehydratase